MSAAARSRAAVAWQCTVACTASAWHAVRLGPAGGGEFGCAHCACRGPSNAACTLCSAQPPAQSVRLPVQCRRSAGWLPVSLSGCMSEPLAASWPSACLWATLAHWWHCHWQWQSLKQWHCGSVYMYCGSGGRLALAGWWQLPGRLTGSATAWASGCVTASASGSLRPVAAEPDSPRRAEPEPEWQRHCKLPVRICAAVFCIKQVVVDNHCSRHYVNK